VTVCRYKLSATLYKVGKSVRDMTSVQQLWIGHAHEGGRATLDLRGPGSKALLLGSESRDLAAVAAISAKEAGASPMIFDLDGFLAKRLSGYFDTYDYRAFLYDSFRLEEPESWHSQLAAAAYSVALDLSSEEEAIINSAMQVVASDSTLLSPVSIHDVMGKVEGFRGFYVDKLNGRIGALRLFDAVDDQSFERLLRGDVILDFHKAPYPQAAELASALFIAKLLAIAHAKGTDSGFLMVTEAHRIFRATPRPLHSNRLLIHLLEWPAAIVLSSSQAMHLTPLLLQSCPVRVYSSDEWHSQPRQSTRILSGTFVLHDRRSGLNQTFVARRVPVKTADYAPARAGTYPSPELAKLLLEEIDRFPLSTPESLVQYIAPEFLPADISSVLASLEKQGCVLVEPKESGSGSKVFSYTLSDKGRKLLEELRK
jgi:hypothetical protein